ncbi:MAG TPA: hypothetical protein VN656_00580 [Stellaceae bacterium]|nr:hypothetical protein [Stellaceae bacterium]
MAHLDLLEKPADADMAALYWWRRDAASREDTDEPAPLARRLIALAERATPTTPPIIDLPGNRLRANAEARRAREAEALKGEIDPALMEAIQLERRNALVALATGIIATAAPAAAALYAATTQEPIALSFALAGTFAASFALYHAARWFLLMRSDDLPKILV